MTALLDAAARGRCDAEAYQRNAAVIRGLDLGRFTTTLSLRSLVALRVLLALRLPWRLLAKLAVPARGTDLGTRIERFLVRYAYWNEVQRVLGKTDVWRRIIRPPVILMYHSLGAGSEAASMYVLPVRALRRHIAWLRWRGYTFMTFADLATHVRQARLPPPRTVVLTFDDGYADNSELGLPVLYSRRVPATIFVVSGLLGCAVTWTPDPTLWQRPLMTTAQVKALGDAGIEVGGHTRNHVSLTDVPLRQAEGEIEGCRTDLERLLAQPVRTFAYPFGDYTPEIADAVRSAGFDAACCSRSGFVEPATALYEFPRVEVRGEDSFFRFVLMLSRGRRPSRGRNRSATTRTQRT